MILSRLLAVLVSAAVASAGRAQVPQHDGDAAGSRAHAIAASSLCQPSWVSTFGPDPGLIGSYQVTPGTRAFATFDDGTGPALYAAGVFSYVGGVSARNVAKWDGAGWTALSSGLLFEGSDADAGCALVAFDDGSGPGLFVGGLFASAGGVAATGVAKWDGSSWSAVGDGLPTRVRALAVYDDGTGPALFAAGEGLFGSTGFGFVARWDGSTWKVLMTGLDGPVEALAVFDDGGGPALYAGGAFSHHGTQGIAKWDGSSWSPVGGGLDGITGVPESPDCRVLAVFDDGGGPALYVGGFFVGAGGVPAPNLVKWDGSSWSGLGSGVDYQVWALGVAEVGGAPILYAGGQFSSAGGVTAGSIAAWDGSSWSEVGGGLDKPGISDFNVMALAYHDDGSGPALYAGGYFITTGGVDVTGIAKWDGVSWTALGSGLTGPVRALVALDEGDHALYAGGFFKSGGGGDMSYIGKWNGSSWAPLSSGVNAPVYALARLDGAGGDLLYAGGALTSAGGVAASRVAQWDGSHWSPLGAGVAGAVNTLVVFDDGGGEALFAGGIFTTAGGLPASRIAKWDGAGWSKLGSGLSATVNAMAVFDDGGGAALYVGGDFVTAGGVAAAHVARWDGSTWSALGSGINGGVFSLAVFDDGGGPALYAGGGFTAAGGVSATRIAKWDGSVWSPVGEGLGPFVPTTPSLVTALLAFDGGAGPALYAAGSFAPAGSSAASSIARWDGSAWSTLGSGVTGGINALASFDGPGGPALYAGGSFPTAPDSGDSYLAKWGCAAIVSVPGCAGNPATLAALAPGAPLGASLPLQITGAQASSGLALLFAGLPGVDGSGCGFVVPGLGELLFALGPQPVAVASGALASGKCELAPLVPSDPSLGGKTVFLQALAADFALPSSIELTNALSVHLGP